MNPGPFQPIQENLGTYIVLPSITLTQRARAARSLAWSGRKETLQVENRSDRKEKDKRILHALTYKPLLDGAASE